MEHTNVIIELQLYNNNIIILLLLYYYYYDDACISPFYYVISSLTFTFLRSLFFAGSSDLVSDPETLLKAIRDWMRGFQRTLMVRGCSGSSSYSIQAGVSFCVCVCVCVCVCMWRGNREKITTSFNNFITTLYSSNVKKNQHNHVSHLIVIAITYIRKIYKILESDYTDLAKVKYMYTFNIKARASILQCTGTGCMLSTMSTANRDIKYRREQFWNRGRCHRGKQWHSIWQYNTHCRKWQWKNWNKLQLLHVTENS